MRGLKLELLSSCPLSQMSWTYRIYPMNAAC